MLIAYSCGHVINSLKQRQRHENLDFKKVYQKKIVPAVYIQLVFIFIE